MADKKIYVPKQRTNRGVAGYRGVNVVIVGDAPSEQEPAPVLAPKPVPVKTTGKANKAK